MVQDPAPSDDDVAIRVADIAGGALARLQPSGLFDGKPLGAVGDALAHELIARLIATLRPDDGFLSEEGAADPGRLALSRVWIIDPLDGTREFSEGRDDWAVHVALTIDGVPAASAVAQPGLGMIFSSGAPLPLPAMSVGPMRIAVSRSRCPEIANQVVAALGAECVPMGSAGAKAMAVVRGDVHAYLHAGGQYEWDSCAPAGVAAAAGLHVSALDGSPLRYNRPDPYMPDLLICRPELASALLAAVAAAS